MVQASQEQRFAAILVEFALQMTALLDQINKVGVEMGSDELRWVFTVKLKFVSSHVHSEIKIRFQFMFTVKIENDPISGFISAVSITGRTC